MKKIYLIALAALIGSTAMAQVSVTFQVDMNGQTVSPDGVHVAGNFQAAAGFPQDWQPNTAQLADDDSDGIYTLTVDIPAGQYEYKFLNGNDWPMEEGIPVVSQKGGGNSNRFFAVTDWHAANGGWMMPANLFGGSAPAGRVAVRLQIDMANQTVTDLGVHVAGDIVTPNWTPGYGTATPYSGAKYAYVTHVDPNASYQYKFLNGNDWGADEFAPAPCGNGDGNRVIEVVTTDLIAEASCFGTCGTCAPAALVTFIVNLNGAGTISPDGGFIAGAFNGWSGEAMTDMGDGVYSITLTLDAGDYAFKFQNGNGGWEGNIQGDCAADGGGDRTVTVNSDGEAQTYGPYCFGTCDAECAAIPDPANITFQVDMNAQTVSPDGVWLIGNFTIPAWQPGAISLSDGNGDGIYETTVVVSGPATFEYKFVNGDVFVAESDEFNGNTEQLACNIPSGNGGWNRVHTRSGVDEVLTVVPFNECGPVSVSNIHLGKVSVFPNPTSGNSFIELENPNGYNLRLSIVDITGKTVVSNQLINSSRFEIKTSNLGSGLYFLNVVNEKSERATYKLIVQ